MGLNILNRTAACLRHAVRLEQRQRRQGGYGGGGVQAGVAVLLLQVAHHDVVQPAGRVRAGLHFAGGLGRMGGHRGF